MKNNCENTDCFKHLHKENTTKPSVSVSLVCLSFLINLKLFMVITEGSGGLMESNRMGQGC